MKKQKMQYFKLEERVLFEAGAVIQAAEAAAADQAAAEHSNDGEAAAADDAADQTNNAELAEINTEPGADAVAFAAADTEGKTLIVINSSVKDAEQIYNDMGKNCEILLLEAGTDALDAINAYLDAHNDNLYSAIHIVSHGNEGFLMLNGEKIDNSSLDPADWKGIGEHLTLDADILIYGCDTAANAEGRALIRNIADLTGADVAASANATGADGDWDLEYRTGLIEEATLAPQDYAHSLETVTLTVTETADTANNKFATLADAVAAATDTANDYLIVFDSAYFDGTNVGYVINITETISISTSATITIDGDLNDDGAGDIILDGGNTVTTDATTGEITYGTNGNRILKFSGNNVNVTLTGLTIQNAYTDGSGGAVYFDTNAKLTVVNTIFRQNYAAGSGGAIYHSTGTLTVRDSIFTKNYSAGAMITGEKSGTGGGGAIGNNGERAETYVSNSTFTANHSDGNGGAIYYYTNAVLDIDNCIFTQNSAGKEGGAVYTSWTRTYINNATFTANHADSSGGAASVRFSLVTITDSTIVNNTTNGSGAVFVSHKDSAKVIINSIIVGNQKIKNDGTAEDSDIYYYFPGEGETFLINTLYGTIVKSGQYAEYEAIPDPANINSAVATVEEIFGTATPTPGADGTLAITDSGAAAIAGTLVGRTGTNNIYTYYYLDTANNQWVSAVDSTVTVAFDAADTATYGLTGGKVFTTAQNKDSNGDAVSRVKTMLAFNAGAYALEAETPSLQVTATNDALNPFDGNISLREAVYYAENGLVAADNGTGYMITFADSITTITLADELKITGLTAGLTIDGAGKVTVKVADSVYDYLKSVNTDLSALTAIDMQTQLDTAIADSAISTHRVFNVSGSVVTLSCMMLEGGCTGTDNNGAAGAILYADKTSTVTADLVNFRGGIATTGGIIYSAGKLTVTNSEIAYGVTKSTSAIGALVVTTGETLLQDTTLHHGITRNYGGAIEFSSSNAPVVLDGVEIYATHGGRVAGAIRIQKGDVTIRDSYIHDNNCNNGGNLSNGAVFEGAAAIYITGGANVEILNSTITANTNSNMWEDGGAVMVTEGTLYLVNSTVSGNTNCPAGINTSGSSAKAYIINSVLTGNDVNDATHTVADVPERDILAVNGGTVNIINSVYGNTFTSVSETLLEEKCGYTSGVVNTDTASVSGVTYEDVFGTAVPVDGSIAITATGAAAYAGTLVGKLDGVYYYLSNGKWINTTDATAATYTFDATDTVTYGLTGGEVFTTAQNKDANGNAVSRVQTTLAFNAGSYALDAESAGTVVTTTKDAFNPFDGVTSLREAVFHAAADGSVTVADALATGGTPALELDDTLTIDKNLVFDSAFGVGTAGIEIAENVTLTLNHSFSTGSISNLGALIVKDGFSVTTAPATYGNVSYTGADQNILAGTYDDLTLSGSGTKTMLADVTVSGVFSAADITLTAADTTGASNHLNLADTASSITGANANISGTKFVNVNVNQDGTANGGLLYLDSASNSVENSSGIRLIGNTVTIEAPIVYGTVMGDIVITVKDGAGNVVRNDTASNLGWEWQNGNQSVQNAGTASYTITSGDDLYAFSGDLAVTISKAQIMVMGNATSVTYDGNAHTLSGATLLNGVNNVLAGHVVSAVEFDASYTDANMNPGYSISIVADSVKIADANGADMTGNYEITQYIAGTLFINQAILTVKGNYTETTYNGTAQTLSGATVSGNTLLAGHKLGDVTFGGSATNAGDHWINVTSAVILDSSNNDVTANYNIAYVEGLLKIAAAELTITAGSITETYNGSAFSVDTSTATGLVSGHTVQSVTYGGSGTDAGEYAATVSDAVIVDAAGADVTANYDITYTDGKITINKLAVTVTGEELGVIYNGAEQTISNATITGAVAGHTLNSADFGNGGTDVGEYAVTVSDAVIFDATGADVTANYDITYTDGKITIAKRAVTVTADDRTVPYDGKGYTLESATAENLPAGQSIDTAVFGEGGKMAGTYTVSVSNAVIRDAAGRDVTANFDITYVPGILTIEQTAEGQNSNQDSANGLSINQTSAAYTLTSEQHLKPYNAQLQISSTSYQNPADLSLMLSAELRNTHSAAAGLADQHPAGVDDSMRNRRPVSDLLRFSGDVTTISPDGTMTSLGIRDGENAISDSLGHRDGGDLLHNHVDEEHLRKFGDESEILDIQLSRASACMDEFDEALAEMMEVEFA